MPDDDDVIVQDPHVIGPPVRLRLLLALLRITAGRRGYAVLSWWGQGFSYTLTARRQPPTAFVLDRDRTDAPHADTAAALIRSHLEGQ